ncbi:MAG: GDP-mannose 4,6-dehydratase [Muribaculum sp.]|nr:GDP-mannose 4,6-dehydratase [Muribaculum sp.]
MKILVVGGCGFLGSNLAAYGIKSGHDIAVFDNLSRTGAAKNLTWLETIGEFRYIHGDTRNRNDVDVVIRDGKFDAVFHLAGQVAMTTSIVDPYKDFQTNAMGTLHVLDAIRKYSPNTVMMFSSTNKVYGDLEQYHYQEADKRYICTEWPNGFDESIPLDFRSPYGCSKGAADQYMLDYSRIYGIKTIVFRHSSMYGGRQFATYDQGWVGWFCSKALEKKQNANCEPFTISGNGKQVRDILHAEDMIELYYTALRHADEISGEVFNIGGGMEQSLSLLELFELLEEALDIKLTYRQLPPRISDQKVFVADISKIKQAIDWKPKVTAKEGIAKMLNWMRNF